MEKSIYTILFIVFIVFSSCISQKKTAYLYGLNENAADSINAKMLFKHEAYIHPGDMLTIIVSGKQSEVVAPYNLTYVGQTNTGSNQLYSSPTLQSYTVDMEGNINFPELGKIKISGLTKQEAEEKITDLLSDVLINHMVNIQFLNQKITVMGEVARPGVYSINNKSVTIMDALALAGDMTIYGKRRNVLITRNNDGVMEFQRLNLNSPDILTSPYYYVKQDDMIYVEPNTVRTIAAQNISLYISSISTLATLATVILTISK